LFVFETVLELLVCSPQFSNVVYLCFVGMKRLLTYGWYWSIVLVGIYFLYYGRYSAFHCICFVLWAFDYGSFIILD